MPDQDARSAAQGQDNGASATEEASMDAKDPSSDNDPQRWWNAALDELWKAEYAARTCELERNEGDADAIRRDAIRSILGLGVGDEMYATRELQEKHRGL